MASFSELRDRVVLITGGANGIGTAMVRAFHAQGARVFFCDCEVKPGTTLAKQLDGEVFFQKVDLLKEREIVRWIDGVGRRAGRIDVLINNAAADPRIPLGKTTVADWDRLHARNLRAFFLTARESVKWMRPGAAIVNFSSITFHISPANMTAYVATKAGIIGFTRALARELGPRRIRANTLSPGWVMTERQKRMFVTSATKKLIRRSQCIADLIQPEEIADVALFLAGDSSRAITGQEILVDRGWAHS